MAKTIQEGHGVVCQLISSLEVFTTGTVDRGVTDDAGYVTNAPE